MKRTPLILAETARTVSRKKYSNMSAKKKHELLWALSRETLCQDGDRKAFETRYRELQSWSGVDRYSPPGWLSDSEALSEYAAFHGAFSKKYQEMGHAEDSGTRSISWQPELEIGVVLDQVRSPYNVGSMLRIIDNFGLKGLVHGTRWLNVDHPHLVKAARGCQQWIPVQYEKDLPGYLKTASCPVIGIDDGSGACPLDRWDPPARGILVVGNEEYGISQSIRATCDRMVYIPMAGFKKSMNVNQALAVVAHKVFTTHIN